MSMPSPPDERKEEAGGARHLEPPPGTADFKAVARVSTQARLVTVRLARINATLRVDPKDVPASWSEQADLQTYSDATLDETGTLTALCCFEANCKLDRDDEDDGSGTERPLIGIAADFALVYKLAEPNRLEIGDVEQFARVNGFLHAWPYWRELAQSTSVRMAIPALIIQTFKVPSPYDPGAASTEQTSSALGGQDTEGHVTQDR